MAAQLSNTLGAHSSLIPVGTIMLVCAECIVKCDAAADTGVSDEDSGNADAEPDGMLLQ